MKIMYFILVCLISWFACETPQDLQGPVVKEQPVRKTKDPGPQARNIILLIGDGMGLSQISGSMYNRKGDFVFDRFKKIGLHKCHSSDNLVTDSAAGATAFASGVKTFNGALGVDENSRIAKTLIEEAEEKGMATGMVVTSSIVHATPASFFAHVDDRNKYEEIASFFMETDIDLIIGGGKAYFDRRKDNRNLMAELKEKGYVVSDYFETPFEETTMIYKKNFAYFTADTEPLSVSQGRDYLISASSRAISYLDRKAKDGFFIMIEGAQIDWGGHARHAGYVLSELAEFEEVIGNALDFAEKDGNTLVLVTADHETGGFAINPGSTMGDLKIEFTTNGHTASMIPVFAYGPGAEEFTGIYENTEIYHKIRKVLGW